MALALPERLIAGTKTVVKAMRFNGTTSIGRIPRAALPAGMGVVSGMSALIVHKPFGAHENGFGYFFSWSDGTTNKPFMIYHDSTNNRIYVRSDSVIDATPYAYYANTVPASGVVSTLTGATSSSGTYDGAVSINGKAVSAAYTTNGSDPLVKDTTADLCIGNTTAEDRAYNGEIALIALFRREARAGQLNRLAILGPSALPRHAVYAVIVEGQDIGPNKLPIKWTDLALTGSYAVPLAGY